MEGINQDWSNLNGDEGVNIKYIYRLSESKVEF